MGTLHEPVSLMGTNGKTVDLDVLIDVEAIFGYFPASLLAELGVTRCRSVQRGSLDRYRDGLYRMGQVEAVVHGEAGYITCIFADEDEPPRLGTHNLDSLLLQVDTETNSLVPKEFRVTSHF